ncbi:MAG: ABC transporter substrate-binding protein [Planctomycetes bacterium]|nr:ABC transporter substrate-binding protein [Planctomycetota bacterium]
MKAALGLTLSLVLCPVLRAQGVSDTEIVLGQACALKGQAAGLGSGMQTGLQVWFDQVNASGGVHGRKIRLVSVNDGYEPERCAAAVKMLIEQEKVFAVIGGVGTPTAKVAVPICTEAKVPFVGAFTGAELLRAPYNRYVVNVRASYFQETEALVRHLVDQRGLQRIACFYQDDAYGQAGLEGMQRALAGRKIELVGKGTYKRNTLAVAEGLQQIATSKPQAIVLVGAYAPCAEFMKQAKSDPALREAKLCNISFVGSDNLLKAAGPAGEGSLISQVVPLPTDASMPLVAEYQAAMKKAGKQAEIGFISLEGYLVGKVFTEMAQKAGKNLTRDALLEAVAKSSALELGGVSLAFGPQDNQGCDAVFLTTIHGDKIENVSQPAVAAPAK